MKKNIFTLLAEKKSVVVGATLAVTLSLSAGILASCNPDNPTPGPGPNPQPPEPQEVTYMVSFETNGGSKVDSVEVKENAVFPDLLIDNACFCISLSAVRYVSTSFRMLLFSSLVVDDDRCIPFLALS